MIGLILTIVIGFGIAYFSTKSTADINFVLGGNTYFNIPLYFFTVASYVLGILLAWVIEIPQSVATAFQIIGLGRSVKSGNNTIVGLQNKIKKLEIENNSLRNRNHTTSIDKQTEPNYKPNVIHNVLHRLNLR